jgi:hypothetical protein
VSEGPKVRLSDFRTFGGAPMARRSILETSTVTTKLLIALTGLALLLYPRYRPDAQGVHPGDVVREGKVGAQHVVPLRVIAA